MIIERLNFDCATKYDPEEASIHVARYQLAKSFIKNKRVLDIACGEGYGSALLKQWGAKEVVGVDISEGSILNARKNFSSEGVIFICGNAEQMQSTEKFDVIVSFETIEHISDPEAYLYSLKSVLDERGVVIISCPNDYWYYKDNESNPYHIRKYTFQDFIEQTSKVLLEPSVMGIATNVVGFGNMLIDPKDFKLQSQFVANSACDIVLQNEFDTLVSPNLRENLPNIENCLYYFAIWSLSPDIDFKEVCCYNIFPIAPLKSNLSKIDEYKIAFESGEKMINARDEAIASMEKMIQERDAYILKLEQMVNELKSKD